VDHLKNSIRPSKEELLCRTELAACYRLIDHFGMSDLIFTHITSKSPGPHGGILINRYGQLFSEVCASDLVEIDSDGNILFGEGPINRSGCLIHAAIHRARPDAMCVIHTHSVAGIAVSKCKTGLLPISQHAMKFYNRIAHHTYEGIILEAEEGKKLVRALGNKQAAILHNHGLLAIGRTVPEAFHVM
jgi:ribulose-5-phosphate 4-epimerase/fuculose-1-phosphate aldolase